MKKKSIWLILVALILSVVIFAGCSPKKTEEKNTTKEASAAGNDDKIFVIGLDDSFPPMGFRDEKNEIVGFDIDLATEVAKRMGMEFKAQPINWDTKELELDGGNIDAIWNGLTVTEERQKAMEFSKPYLKNAQVVIVKNDSPIKVVADLEGKNIGIQKGSSALDAFNANPIKDKVASLNEYLDNVAAFQDLDIGRVDAVVVDEIVGRYYIKTNNAVFTVLEDKLAPEVYAVGFKKGNTELRDKVDKALTEMVADGTAAKISEKWFGENIYYTGQ